MSSRHHDSVNSHLAILKTSGPLDAQVIQPESRQIPRVSSKAMWRRAPVGTPRNSSWSTKTTPTSQAANAWSTVGQRLSDVERSVRAEDGSWRLVELARLVLTEPRRVSDLTA